MSHVSLAKYIANEFSLNESEIFLIRHSNQELNKLKRYNASIHEYTAIQPVGSKYDFFLVSTRPTHLVVIAYDIVHGVYRIGENTQKGIIGELGSLGLRAFDQSNLSAPRPAAYFFDLVPLDSKAIGKPVLGWEKRSRTPTQKFGAGFFHEIWIPV